MKKTFLTALATGLLLFGLGGVGHALTMTDVVSVDQFIVSAYVNSGDDKELKWVNDELLSRGLITTAFSSFTKIEEEKDAEGKVITPFPDYWDLVTGTTSTYAYDFESESPEFFFIKTGNISGTDSEHFLYKNLDSFRYAVINLSVTPGITIKNIGKFSHMGYAGTAPIPEPGTMLLFGTGLAGLAAVGRRRKN